MITSEFGKLNLTTETAAYQQECLKTDELLSQIRNSVQRWNWRIISRGKFKAHIVAIPDNGFFDRVCFVIEPSEKAALESVEHNFKEGAQFTVVIKSDDTLRHELASALYADLPPKTWGQVHVISPKHAWSSLRWMEWKLEEFFT